MLQNQRTKLAQAKVRMQQLEMKEKADKEAMKQLEAKRQEKIKERLVERENLHKNILAIIPARSGSKGLPGKNIRLLNDIPLIGHAGLVANACEFIDKTVRVLVFILWSLQQ